MMFSKILVAVGSSEDVVETLPVVSGLARSFHSKVLVVHMRERIVTSRATLEKETIHESFQFGENVARRLVEAGIDAASDIDSHRPDRLPEFILDKAKEFGAELIIVGGHHAHGLRDRMFGDLGRRLAHGTRCPLLLMPSGPE